jgi:hypothetical protein
LSEHKTSTPASSSIADNRVTMASFFASRRALDESDTRVLASTATAGPPLIIGLRLERDPQALNAGRISCFIEPHSGNSDARVIASRHQPREDVELAIRTTSGRRIQDALDLLGIARLRFHHHFQALQCKPGHQFSSETHDW